MLLRRIVYHKHLIFDHCYLRLRIDGLRRFASMNTVSASSKDVNVKTPEEITQKNNEFVPVYNFPYIRHVALFNRFKMFIAAGTAIAIPVSCLLCNAGLISTEVVWAFSIIGVTTTVTFSLASLPTSKVIGFLYISKDNKLLKIAYVDYWGKRIERIVPVDDWVPLSEIPTKYSNLFYLSPRLDSDPNPMKLVTKYGIVLDKEKMGFCLE